MDSKQREIFEHAIQRSGIDRSEYLDRACAGNPGLRQAVESLLAAHEEAGQFLDAPTGDSPRPPSTSDPVEPTAFVGVVIGGKYKLLQPIGEGGFGNVYLSEQLAPVRRRVAVKVIKPGMDSRQVIARFEAERQALAMMDHPNIARVFDGGTTDAAIGPALAGRPYFVMELVKGEPITTYCDRQHIGIHQRLHLFKDVCSAVQHAHQKGVIHRDIKPANVLITVHDGKPMVKVIDFGIAKAVSARLTEKTLFTEFKQLIGTPEYMSPEQAEAIATDVDTRSDIYSLGVLLYELLTGVTPFDGERLRSAAYGEMQRIIREEEPPKPSTRLHTLVPRPGTPPSPLSTLAEGEGAVGRQVASAAESAPKSPLSLASIAQSRAAAPQALVKTLRGDLDWIVMKCLEKDRTRRYDTATAVADDVDRHLTSVPIVAAPPSAAYRLKRFVRRNRKAAVIGSTVSVALIIAVAGTSFGLWRTSVAAKRMERAGLEVKQERDKAIASEAKLKRRNEVAESALGRISEEFGPIQISGTHHFGTEEDRESVTLDMLVLSAQFGLRNAMLESYRANVAAAAADVEANNPASARERLDYCPEKMRGWEWRYLSARCDDSVNTFAIAPMDPEIPATFRPLITGARFTLDGTSIFGGTMGTWPTDGGWLFEPSRFMIDAASGNQLYQAPMAYTAKGPSARSPDGMNVASSWNSDTIFVINLASYRTSTTLHGHSAQVRHVEYSRDGTRIASIANDDSIRIWDATSGNQISKVDWKVTNATRICLSPNGHHMAIADFDSVDDMLGEPDDPPFAKQFTLIDTANGTTIATVAGVVGSHNQLRFAGDGRLLFAWNPSSISVFESDTGKKRSSLFDSRLGRVLAVSQDGNFAATSSGTSVEVRFPEDAAKFALAGSALWSFSTGAVPVVAATFDPSDEHLAVLTEDGVLQIFTIKSGGCVATMRGMNGASEHSTLVFNPQGTKILTTGLDMTAMYIWDAAARPCPRLELQRGLRATVSADGMRVFALDGTGYARLWQRKTHGWDVLWKKQLNAEINGTTDKNGHIEPLLPTDVRSYADVSPGQFSPDGTKLLVCAGPGAPKDFSGREVLLVDVATGTALHLLRGHSGRVHDAKFSRSGKRVVTRAADHSVRVWDVDTGRQLAKIERSGVLPGWAEFASDDAAVLTAWEDSLVRISNLESDAVRDVESNVGDGHNDFEQELRLSHDGKCLAIALKNRGIKLLDATSGVMQRMIENVGMVGWMEFAPNDDALLVRTYAPDGGHLNLYSVRDGASRAVFGSGRPFGLKTAAFSPDGSRIVTTGWRGEHFDSRARIWDAETGQELLVLEPSRAGLDAAFFAPNGESVITIANPGYRDGEVRLYDSVSWRERYASIGEAATPSTQPTRRATRIMTAPAQPETQPAASQPAN